jgi:uncharacterized repeat protein (TIGR02543 family)
VTSTENPLTVTITANTSITANFALKSYTLAITATNGTVSQSASGTEFDHNTELVLTATPAEGYEFVNWTGDVTSTDNPLTVTITANTSITANFAIKSYTLAITATNGTVSQSVTGTEFDHYTELILTATPDEGYEFVNWSGDVNSTDNPLTLTITSSLNITANFTPNTSVRENGLSFEVFPNPSNGIFTVLVMQPVSYRVYSINGLLVKSGNAAESFKLDLSGFNNAIYILQIESKEGVSVKRIMKTSE